MEAKLSYQFNVQFIKKNDKWSKDVYCVTYSSKHDVYLYSLVGSVISYFQIESLNDLKNHILNIENAKLNQESNYLITDEGGTVGLLFQGEKVKILDLIHTEDGIVDGMQGPINYNISTPLEYQFLDAAFVLKLLSEWCMFLSEQENLVLVPKSHIKAGFL